MFAGEPVSRAEAVRDLRARVLRRGAGHAAWTLIRVGRTDGDGGGSRLRWAFEAVGPRRRFDSKYCADADDERERERCDAGRFHGASFWAALRQNLGGRVTG